MLMTCYHRLRYCPLRRNHRGAGKEVRSTAGTSDSGLAPETRRHHRSKELFGGTPEGEPKCTCYLLVFILRLNIEHYALYDLLAPHALRRGL